PKLAPRIKQGCQRIVFDPLRNRRVDRQRISQGRPTGNCPLRVPLDQLQHIGQIFRRLGFDDGEKES
ncbi:MAG: hypothetical protein K0S99_2048, partial [Thermomicrobiales bacterium]|nr:hypothetical protein [Thermomicrobiales bacterium]